MKIALVTFANDNAAFAKVFKAVGAKDGKKFARKFANQMMDDYGVKVTVK